VGIRAKHEPLSFLRANLLWRVFHPLPLPLSLLFGCHPRRGSASVVVWLKPTHHLDRSCSQSHREQPPGETSAFRLVFGILPLSLLFLKQQGLDTPARINSAEPEKPGAAGLSFARHNNN
jgi:hypothetical protein